jgi:hypothetical protein
MEKAFIDPTRIHPEVRRDRAAEGSKPFRSLMEHAPRDLVRVSPRSCAEGVTLMDRNPRRDTMITKQLILVGCAALILSVGAAQAGPCNTDGRSVLVA